jgi:hypothetical protein
VLSLKKAQGQLYLYLYKTTNGIIVVHILIFTCLYMACSSGHAVRVAYGLDLSNTGIVGLNLARGMDLCPHFTVLWCPGYVDALKRADPTSKVSYQNVQKDS